jgi:hypothetical protein
MICEICKQDIDCATIFEGKKICMDCHHKIRTERILTEASKSDDCSFFKTWSSKDRTTAFFEAFGRYVKEPNERDFNTIYYIWLWAVHDDKALVETISYTLKWAGLTIHGEHSRWRNRKTT